MGLVLLHDSELKRQLGSKEKFPNLVLMKLSAWHKSQGDLVKWYEPYLHQKRTDSIIYSSKVFNWTKEEESLPNHTIKGGTGYNLYNTLPNYIEHICPDYTLYGNMDYSMGFLTRGCSRNCSFCVVRKKEGRIRANADIKEFCRHKKVVLMDNNVLACDHGINQIEKMARLGLNVDFNQGLDARLIDKSNAKILSKVKWFKGIRLACDHKSQMKSIGKAVELLRNASGCKGKYSCYLLIKEDVEDAYERVLFLQSLGIRPFGQPYRDLTKMTEPTYKQKQFARWCNRPELTNSIRWDHFWKQQRDKFVIKQRQMSLPLPL